MAVSWVATGSRDTAGTTTLAIPVSTGIQAGRLSLLTRVVKPDTATFNVPSGWTHLASYTGGTGSQGTDVGPSHVGIDYRVLDGSESGTITSTQANSPNSATGFMITYQATPGASWSIASVGGADASHGTGRTATGTAIALAPGDVVVAVCGSDTDSATAFTSPAITAPGITFGATTERRGAGGGTSGQDVGQMAYEATVTAGTATAAPTLTLAGGPSNCGPVAFVRLRQTSPTIPVPQVIESESAQFPTVRKIVSVPQVTETETALSVTPVSEAKNIDIDWRASDVSRFEKKLFTVDGVAASQVNILDDIHEVEVIATAGPVPNNNLREALIFPETAGWADGVIETTWGTRSFFGGVAWFPDGKIIPQHGYAIRYQESGGQRRAIIIWQNVVFDVNWTVLAGVWTSNLDGTGFTNRQYGLQMTGLNRIWTVTGSERAGNVVTLTISDVDPLPAVGDPLRVDVATASFNGFFFISEVTPTTISYAQTGANESGGAGTCRHVFPYTVEASIQANHVSVRAWPPENPALKPEWLNVDTSAGVQLPGTAGNYLSTPDAAAFDITSDITLMADFTPSAFPPSSNSSLISKFLTTGNQRSYRMRVDFTGRIAFQWTTTGTTTLAITSTVAPTLTNGRVAVKAQFDVNNGAAGRTCTFWQAPTSAGPWTQLGDPVTTANATSIFSSSANVEIGSINDGALELFNGRIHAAYIRSGLEASFVEPAVDFDAGVVTSGVSTFNDRQNVSWSVNGTAAIVNEGAPAGAAYAFSVDIDKAGSESARIDAPAPVGTGEIGLVVAHLGTSDDSRVTFGPVFARNSVGNFTTEVLDTVTETETAQAVTRSTTVTPAVVTTTAAVPAVGVSVGAGPAVTARSFTVPATGESISAGPAVTATSVTVGSPAKSVGAGPAVIARQFTLLASGESVGAGPSVIARQFTLPASGESVTAAPAVVSTAVAVPQTGESVGASPNAVPGLVSLPQASVSAGFTVSPAVIATSATVLQTGVNVAARPATAAVAFALPAAVPQAGESISASPGAINSQVTLPASAQLVAAAPATTNTATAVPQTGESVGASPDSIATSVAVPQTTAAAGFTVSPAVIATTTTVPQAAPNVGASPVTVAATAAIPQPAVTVSASPAVIAATAVVPQPNVNVTAAATTIATVVSQPQAIAVTTGSATVEPATIAATASVPSVVVNVAARPATIAATIAVPSTSVHVNALLATVSASVSVPAPEIYTTISPSTIATSVTVLGSTVSVAAQSGTVTTAFTVVRPSVNVTAGPNAFATAVSVPLPAVGVVTVVAPAVTAAQVSIPQPAGNVVAGPSTFATAISIPEVVVGATLIATVVAAQVAIPQPGAAVGTGPATVATTVGIPALASVGQPSAIPAGPPIVVKRNETIVVKRSSTAVLVERPSDPVPAGR